MLSILSTPIGNLDDVSIRLAETLMNADIILAEDTRSVQKVIAKIRETFQLTPNPSQQMWSYYKEVEFEKLPDVMDNLNAEKNVCLVSDAGTPVISDPGYLLLTQVIKKGLPYSIIPGPSAVTTALLHSGFNPEQFMFAGFLPKKASGVEKTFRQWIELKKIVPKLVISFFEAPHRINETLALLEKHMPNNRIAVCRELTKTHEEILRGTAGELKDKQFRGEITVVVE